VSLSNFISSGITTLNNGESFDIQNDVITTRLRTDKAPQYLANTLNFDYQLGRSTQKCLWRTPTLETKNPADWRIGFSQASAAQPIL